MVKLPALITVPPAVVRLILPDVAPAGTVSFTLVAETLAIVATAVVLNLAAVTPVRLVPVAVV